MTNEEREEKIEKFGNAYKELSEAIKGLTKEELAYKPAPEKWSVHEIVVHIADAEANSYLRLKRALAEPGTTVMAYDQDKWASELNYSSADLAENLDLFRLLRKMSYDIIKDMPEEKWANQYNHSEYGLAGLDRWLTIYANHITSHVGQIQRNLEAMKS